MPTLFLTKVPKTYNGEQTASSTNVARKSGYLPAENWNLSPFLSLCTSINSKWIKDLKIRPETLKLVQERAGNTLEAIGIGKYFLNRTPASQQLRERMDKWDYMKLKSFWTTKEVVSKLKRPPTEWEKIFTCYIHQRTDNQNTQGAQKTKLPQNQWANKEMGWTE
jgi:hypothetical protein